MGTHTAADHESVLRQHGYHRLRVKEVVQETVDTRSFVLDVPNELRELFAYRPGQFCTFRVRIGDDEVLRSYSMSSTPSVDADLTVTVKRVPGGLVSNWFNDDVAAGDTLEVTKPSGVFCPTDRETPLVAFCGGSGVTPVFSIIKQVLTESSRHITVVYANRDRDSVIFADDLRELQDRYADQLDLRHHFDSESGFLEPGLISEVVSGQHDADVFICGPTPFMDLVESTLHDAGVDPARISIERFNIGPVVAEPPIEPVGDPAMDVTDSVTLILRGKKTTVEYRHGDTVLETARRGGLQPPFSCEAGNCATCMALVREGAATMRVNNALTPDEITQGWVLTCQALPVGRTVTVEYESF